MNDLVEPGTANAEDIELGKLNQSLGFLLRIAQVQVFEFFFEDLGKIGLRPGEFSVLWVIHSNPGVRQGVVAQRMRIKRAHMTKMIRSFEDRGLVQRSIPPEDRRSVELRLTKAGEDFINAHKEKFFSHDDRRPSSLTPAEHARFIALLQKYIGLDTEMRP